MLGWIGLARLRNLALLCTLGYTIRGERAGHKTPDFPTRQPSHPHLSRPLRSHQHWSDRQTRVHTHRTIERFAGRIKGLTSASLAPITASMACPRFRPGSSWDRPRGDRAQLHQHRHAVLDQIPPHSSARLVQSDSSPGLTGLSLSKSLPSPACSRRHALPFRALPPDCERPQQDSFLTIHLGVSTCRPVHSVCWPVPPMHAHSVTLLPH